MSEKISDEVLEQVRTWATEGVDLNGIQKRLQSECGLHLTYMDVRFLLLDHGIEIASPTAPIKKEEKTAPKPDSPLQDDLNSAAGGGRVKVELDDLQLPGTLLSGKAEFPGGAKGAWQIDQLGRFGWSQLTGKPSPDEMQDFQTALTQLLSRA